VKKLFGLILAGLMILGTHSAFAGQTFNLNGYVGELSMAVLTAQITHAHQSLPLERPIIIKLNSGGGSVFAGYKFMNQVRAIQAQGRTFIGVVTGFCASMCFNILQTLDIRASFPFGMLMQHMPSGGDTQALEAIERDMDRLTSKRIGIHKLLWRQIARANIWVGPQDALDVNVLDMIYVEVERTDEELLQHGEEFRFINIESEK